jgi:hypothetical protein
MCLLLVQLIIGLFLLRPFTVLMKQTHAIKQSIFLDVYAITTKKMICLSKTYFSQSSLDVTSHWTKQTRSGPNSAENSANVSAPRLPLTSERQMEAPSRSSRRANSLPSPPAEPVMTAIFFLYFWLIFRTPHALCRTRVEDLGPVIKNFLRRWPAVVPQW